ncbi:MAG TPA: GAF domain-containing sensor histidine kinase [Candidatus Obscuribacterales bacterium]
MQSGHDNELYIKTEQLIHFRLAFAVVSLLVAVGISWFAREELEIYPVVAIILSVVFYSAILLGFLNAGYAASEGQLKRVNAALLALDVVSLTGLVHYTRGVESEIYMLYLLPILLSSYTFQKQGIYGTALFVSLCYVLLLLIENAPLLPFLLEVRSESGLAQAYSHRVWGRILARATLLVAIAFVWARFCQYMSGVAAQGANRLREQLEDNTRLMAELEEKAMREKLINSINSALRSTLDLKQIFATAVDELAAALRTPHCAIICPGAETGEKPLVCEAQDLSKSAGPDKNEGDALLPLERFEKERFSRELCEFVLAHKSSYEKRDSDGKLVKTFLFFDPANDPAFSPVRSFLAEEGISSLVAQPMMYGDESKGVILIGDQDPKRAWLPAELELVKSVAGQVAVAIEHAELVEQLSRKNQDLIQKNLNLDAKNLELRAMQSQLIHQEKMASLGRLVAGIAHELNNPINFVHGNLPYLREYFEDLKRLIGALDELPETHREEFIERKRELRYDFLVTDLDHIIADLNEGAERIRYIVRNLRSFSRLDEAELKEASLKEGLESTLKILSQYYGRDKIPVDTDFADLPAILCYPGQLNQVWMNLLSNAAEAVQGQPGAKVTIKTEKRDNKVVVIIQDNGPGIEPSVQSKIFEPFYTTKPVGQGTGLGLSICHSIIERHGGQIWCESVINEGTKFIVEIPVYAHPSDLANARGAKGQDIPFEPALEPD